MASSERAAQVMSGVTASLKGDSSVVGGLFSVDVSGALPLPMSCGAAFAVEIEDRLGVFAEVETAIVREHTMGSTTYVEWTACLVHAGALDSGHVVAGGRGERIEVNGITVADFEGERIRLFRQYWDLYDRLLAE